MHYCSEAPILLSRVGERFLPGWCLLPCLSTSTPRWSLGFWHKVGETSQPRWSLTQIRACKSHQRCFGSDLPSLELQECLEQLWPFRLAPFIIVPVGFGITKSQLCFISQNPFYLLKADVERGRPARGQGLNPLLPYICVYRFRNAGFGTEFDCVCSTHTCDVFTF